MHADRGIKPNMFDRDTGKQKDVPSAATHAPAACDMAWFTMFSE